MQVALPRAIQDPLPQIFPMSHHHVIFHPQLTLPSPPPPYLRLANPPPTLTQWIWISGTWRRLMQKILWVPKRKQTVLYTSLQNVRVVLMMSQNLLPQNGPMLMLCMIRTSMKTSKLHVLDYINCMINWMSKHSSFIFQIRLAKYGV